MQRLRANLLAIGVSCLTLVCSTPQSASLDTHSPTPTPMHNHRKIKAPYYVVHSEGDRAFGYTFLDPRRDHVPLVVVRPVDQPIDDAYKELYTQALKDKKRAPERLGNFEFPAPAYATVAELARGEPDLSSRLSAASLAKLIAHVGVDENVHGKLHERYDGWADPRPFEPISSDGIWRRKNARLLPNMGSMALPSYDLSGKILTYFTMHRIDGPRFSRPDAPVVSHYVGWKHVVDTGASPWHLALPEQVHEVDVRAIEIVHVDSAFRGTVGKFATLSLGDSRQLLINLDPPGKAKRFVVVRRDQAEGTYDTLDAMLAAHSNVERGAFVTKLAEAVNRFSHTRSKVIHDPVEWLERFGKERRKRVGPPMFTENADLSEYEVVSAVQAPPFASKVKAPTLHGNELVLFARTAEEIAEYRWDTLKLTEGDCFEKTVLGIDPSADPMKPR